LLLLLAAALAVLTWAVPRLFLRSGGPGTDGASSAPAALPCSEAFLRDLGLALPPPGAEDRRCLPQDLVFTGQVSGTVNLALVMSPCRLPSTRASYLPNATYLFELGVSRFRMTMRFAAGRGTSQPSPPGGLVPLRLTGAGGDWVASNGKAVIGPDTLSGRVDFELSRDPGGSGRDVEVTGAWRCGLAR